MPGRGGRNPSGRTTNTGDDHQFRMKIENRYQQSARSKRLLRAMSIISALIATVAFVMALSEQQFDVGTIMNGAQKIPTLIHFAHYWCLVTCCIVGFFGAQKKTILLLLTICRYLAYVVMLTFILVISGYFCYPNVINLPFCITIAAFLCNLIPHTLVMMHAMNLEKIWSQMNSNRKSK